MLKTVEISDKFFFSFVRAGCDVRSILNRSTADLSSFRSVAESRLKISVCPTIVVNAIPR